jgi:hypothetical protein
MARRKVTDDLYTKLVNAFREVPGNANNAANESGCDRRTAKIGYDKGWPKQGMRPIKEVLLDERNEIRAIRAEDERKRREAAIMAKDEARKDAMATKVEEGRAVANVRRNALAFSSVFAKILQGLIPAADRIKTWLTDPDPAKQPKPQEVAKLLTSLALANKMITDSLKTSMELERLRIGNPDEIIKEEDTTVTDESAIAALERIQRTMRRAQAQGQISGGPGGDGVPEFSFDEDDEDVLDPQVH